MCTGLELPPGTDEAGEQPGVGRCAVRPHEHAEASAMKNWSDCAGKDRSARLDVRSVDGFLRRLESNDRLPTQKLVICRRKEGDDRNRTGVDGFAGNDRGVRMALYPVVSIAQFF